jgi:hypothetical protein
MHQRYYQLFCLLGLEKTTLSIYRGFMEEYLRSEPKVEGKKNLALIKKRKIMEHYKIFGGWRQQLGTWFEWE